MTVNDIADINNYNFGRAFNLNSNIYPQKNEKIFKE